MDFQSSLTPEQIEEFKESFLVFDHDGNGRISIQELNAVMCSIGRILSTQELHEIISRVDYNKNGEIDFPEFLMLMSKSISQEEVMHSFRMFDKDGNGFITFDELKQSMHSLNQRLTDLEIEQMIKEADMDGDGRINYFVLVLKIVLAR